MRIARVVAGAILAILSLEAARAASGTAFSAGGTAGRILFVAACVAGAAAGRPSRQKDGRWRVPAAAFAVLAVGIAGAAAAGAFGSIAGALAAVAALFAATLAAARVPARPGRTLSQAILVIALAAAAGGAAMGAVEIESRFADEEIFAALAALPLSVAWLGCWFAARSLPPIEARRSIAVQPGAIALLAAGLAVAGLVSGVAGYQRSFSAEDPPAFPGVSDAHPFLCGPGRPDPAVFSGPDVFASLLARVEAARPVTPPEDGMLALARRDPARAALFRTRLLDEAARQEFSRTGATKYWQYEAALRAYYYPRMRAAFPALFSPDEVRRLAGWFAAINRRALRHGPVDAIYAVAFGKRPEGPYENQEIGAGLIALLETGGLSAPELSAENRRYLDGSRRGWQARFRNNDDSYGYQPEWIQNALFQGLRNGSLPPLAIRRSFEWLLLQAEPDGTAPDYNAGVPPLLSGAAYLGASLLQDPSLLWLSGRALDRSAQRGETLPAQPGVESAVAFEGRSPSNGSCLLYADSGLPNRVGPLAPDKIVFRGGWTPDAAYALLNLRFSGWHRYRATNALVTLRDGERLVEEKAGRPFQWLPLERRLFRDKRVPREFLNGLLVEKTGFAAAVERLTGFGGPWAQDPPFFARVEAFAPGEDRDRSVTSLSGWRGWSQRRTIEFRHTGPVVVLDEADGPAGRRAAVAWHVRGRAASGDRMALDGGAELVLVPLEEVAGSFERIEGAAPDGMDLLYRPARPGRLRLASVFLPRRWNGARVAVSRAPRTLAISARGESLSIPLP